MLDRDRRWDAADVVHPWFVHTIEELPHVRRESFDVAALAFGINGLERERRFAGAARTGDDSHFAQRKIDIDALEIVLARSANLDAAPLDRSSDAFFVRDL